LGKNAIARNKVMIIDGQVAIPRSPTSGSTALGKRLKKGSIFGMSEQSYGFVRKSAIKVRLPRQIEAREGGVPVCWSRQPIA